VSWPQARGDFILGLFPDSLIGTVTDKQGAKSTLILVKPGCLINRNLFSPCLYLVPAAYPQNSISHSGNLILRVLCLSRVHRFTDVGLFFSQKGQCHMWLSWVLTTLSIGDSSLKNDNTVIINSPSCQKKNLNAAVSHKTIDHVLWKVFNFYLHITVQKFGLVRSYFFWQMSLIHSKKNAGLF